MEILYTLFLILGLGYLLLTIFGGLGDALDLGMDGAMESVGLDTLFGLDFSADSGMGEATGLGCSVLAAFMAGFGVLGLVGASAGWNPLLVIGGSVVGGWIMGRGFATVMRYVLAGQSTEGYSSDSLIGLSARVTINTDAGRTGEVMVNIGEQIKYAAREINDAPMQRGDVVEIVDVVGHVLHVKKKS